MAKAQGIIGNFKGKIGNTVGYQLTSSNNKQTQGIRIYQPNVKNPKTSAQAEQRAKLAPINATYRALKMIIDRGNEGLPYGNKSRLAWLKKAFQAQTMPWFVKGAIINQPVVCELTKGSLHSIYKPTEDTVQISLGVNGTSAETKTVGALSTALLATYPSLKNGDQLTFVELELLNEEMLTYVNSFVIDVDSTATIPAAFRIEEGNLIATSIVGEAQAGCLIVSREGENGQHLRSNESLVKMAGYGDSHTTTEAKTAAIESYMASGVANTDWPQDSIQ